MKFFAVVLALFTLTYASAADAMRCKNKVVERGDNQYRFLKLCGEPAFVQKKVVYVSDSVSLRHGERGRYHTHDNLDSTEGYSTTRHNQKRHYRQANKGYSEVEVRHEHERTIEIEIWTYDFGSNRLVQEVKFVDGVAKSIRNRGYGTSSY